MMRFEDSASTENTQQDQLVALCCNYCYFPFPYIESLIEVSPSVLIRICLILPRERLPASYPDESMEDPYISHREDWAFGQCLDL